MLDFLLGPDADPNNTWGHGFAVLPGDVEGGTPPTVDTCVQTISGEGTYNGSWDESCLSENRPQDSDDGGQAGSDYYARFYTFTLQEASDVTISLSSDDDPSIDTFLYLMEGSGPRWHGSDAQRRHFFCRPQFQNRGPVPPSWDIYD